MKRNPLILWSVVFAVLILVNSANAVPVIAQGTSTPIPADQLTVTALDSLPFPNNGSAFLSPDGTLIAFATAKEICIYSAAGEKQNCIPRNQSADPNSVRWSPDSKRIAFTENFFVYVLEPDIWVMDVATGKATNLTSDNIDKVKPSDPSTTTSLDVLPTWSADGKRLVFVRYNGSKNPPSIYSIDASGGEAKLEGTLSVANGYNVFALALSPDGKQIAYNVGTNRKDPSSGLWIANLDGSNPRQLLKGSTDPKGGMAVTIPTDIQFSADGKFLLAYDPFGAAGRGVLNASTNRVVAVDGSGDFPVNAEDDALFATWGADGTSLLYVVRDYKDTDRAGLYVVAKPGDKGRQIYQGEVLPPALGWRTLSSAANNTLLANLPDRNDEKRHFTLMHLGTK